MPEIFSKRFLFRCLPDVLAKVLLLAVVIHINLLVQSNKKDPEYLEWRINEFFVNHKQFMVERRYTLLYSVEASILRMALHRIRSFCERLASLGEKLRRAGFTTLVGIAFEWDETMLTVKSLGNLLAGVVNARLKERDGRWSARQSVLSGRHFQALKIKE